MIRTNHLQEIKALAKANGKDILPEIKLPKKRKERAKETAPRKQPERLFRNKTIKHLRGKGCVVKRIENAITGKHNTSIPDLWVFCLKTRWAGWIELKSLKGHLSRGQIEFRNTCHACGVKHLTVKKLDQLKEIYYESI